MPETILSLDIGTTTAKALLFDIEGKELAIAERPYPPLITPKPGWFEQNAEDVWDACVDVLRLVSSQRDADTHILGIAIACQGGSLIPALADGTPLHPMITWMDKRSEAIVRKWRTDGLEPKIRDITGWLLDPGLPLPMIAWLRENRLDIFTRTERWLSLNDYIAHRLTGEFCMTPSLGAAMQFFNIRTGQWSQEICDLVCVKTEQFSPIQPADAVVGCLTAEVQQLTGIGAEVPVINGGQDHSAEAVTLGMISAGDAWLGTGTAWVINGIMEEPAVERVPANMSLNYHTLPQRWTISQLIGGIGASIEWWINLDWKHAGITRSTPRAEFFSAITEEVQESPPGSHGLIYVPLTGTSQLENNTSYGGFAGLRLDHNHADMSRAMLEGAGFELRWALESIASAGMPVDHLWLIGGAARSPVWPDILCNITGIPISTTQYKHGPALGVAIIAGVKVGVYQDIEDGRSRFTISAHHFQPEPVEVELYNRQYLVYRKTARTLGTLHE